MKVLPLYHGIELIRWLTTGTVGAIQFLNVAYLRLMGLIGMGNRRPPHRGLLLK